MYIDTIKEIGRETPDFSCIQYMTFTKFQMSNSYCKSFNIGYSECCIYTFHLKKIKINARKISHSVLPFWYPHGLWL